MFVPSERAYVFIRSDLRCSLIVSSGVFGWYLLGPLLGPTLGPLLGGIVTEQLGWRWIFWILTIVCLVNTLLGILFLKETYAPIILQARRRECEKDGGQYRLKDELEDSRALSTRLSKAMQRPLKILFFQPIVFTMVCFLENSPSRAAI